MIKTAIVVALMTLGSLSAQANVRCKAFAGGGDNYGIVAIGSSAEDVRDACEARYTQCTITCGRVDFVRCFGYYGNTEVTSPFRGSTAEEVAAKCDAANKDCAITCGRQNGRSDGGDDDPRHGGR